MKIEVLAPAKINLYLDVLSKRSDGYHNVSMIMQSIGIFDKITISLNNSHLINLTSNIIVTENISKNTAYISAKKFFSYTKINNPGIDIHVEKVIPVCAGLAGGSSDAAAVLVGLNEIFKTNLDIDILAKIGAEIGADVPFCLYGGTMLSTETGTTLMKLNDIMPPCHIVLVKPNFSVSTKQAYDEVDSLQEKPKINIQDMILSINNNDLTSVCEHFYNKFEKSLNIEEIFKIKSIFNENNAINSCMSGSGPTVFGVFDNKDYASICCNKLKQLYDQVFLTKPISHGCIILK